MLFGHFSFSPALLLAIVARSSPVSGAALSISIHSTHQPLNIEMEDLSMTMINLRDVYPFYHSDLLVEVSEDIAEAMTAATRQESNSRRQMYRYKAQYSLNRGTASSIAPCTLPPLPLNSMRRKKRSRLCTPPWPPSRKSRAAGCSPITYSA